MQDEDYTPLMKILKKNHYLTDLRIENIRGYQNFFMDDISENFTFKLKKLSIGIPSSETINGTAFEENIMKLILANRETLEELRLSHASAKIYNEILANFPKLKNVYATYFIGFNEIICQASRTIERFVIPLSTIEGCQAFIPRLPLVQFLFIQGIDLEILRSVVLQMPYLKILSYNNERGNCTRHYPRIVAENDFVNREVIFKQVERLRFDTLSFEKMFGVREEEIIN